jgi:hypothetical protein
VLCEVAGPGTYDVPERCPAAGDAIGGRALAVALILCSLLSIPWAFAAPVGAAPSDDAALAKVGSELRALYRAYVAAQASGRALVPPDPAIPIVDDRVVIDATASADVEVLKAGLVALGLREVATAGRIVSGELPIAAIPAMASLVSLRFARAAQFTTHDRAIRGVR